MRPFSVKEVPYGASEIEVIKEKVSIKSFNATAISGLSVEIYPHPTQIPNLFLVVVTGVGVFTNRYQVRKSFNAIIVFFYIRMFHLFRKER